MEIKKVCIVGASGKLGQYMVQHSLDRGYQVVGVCREKSIEKLEAFKEKITIVPGMTNNRDVIKEAVKDCDGILTVLAPWGGHGLHRWILGLLPAVKRRLLHGTVHRSYLPCDLRQLLRG